MAKFNRKEYKCDICSKKFNNKKSLSNHRRWHSLDIYKKFQQGFIKKARLFNLEKSERYTITKKQLV